MILLRVGWKLLLPWCLACLLAGLLLGGYWGHRGMQQHTAARIAELTARNAVAEAALASFAPDKFRAYQAKMDAVKQWNRE